MSERGEWHRNKRDVCQGESKCQVSNRNEDEKDDEEDNHEDENKAAQDYLVPSSSYIFMFCCCVRMTLVIGQLHSTAFTIQYSYLNKISLISTPVYSTIFMW